ncbi:MAG: glycoside hydrolase family 2 [Bacteroides sp.]|nr:glycoside hydrolase family 2 [Bacteroides sp.]
MKKIITSLFAMAIFLSGQPVMAEGFDTLKKTFIETPKDQPLAVYWYWIDGNMSEEGVVKDLQAMKKVGINRVQIGMIGDGQGAPTGPVKMFTKKWWKILHTMFKTATELDIEVGLFNCPGWSQSGGPWVKPEQSMRYLAAVNDTVQGPVKYHAALPALGKDGQDVKVLAYPLVKSPVKFTTEQQILEEKEIIFKSEKSAVVRSLVLYPAKGGRANMQIAVKKGNDWKMIDTYHLDRSNTQNNVGFIPLAPFVFSLPEVEGEEFRVTLSEKGFIGNIELSDIPQVELYAEKTLAKMFPEPLPMWNEYLWRTQPEYAHVPMLQSNQVKDITANMTPDGTLVWDVPEGTWIISRTGMLPTGVTNSPAPKEGRGLETDKMSKEHIRAHFDNYIGKIIKRIPAKDRKTFRYIIEDSYETGGQNWTDGLIEDFKQVYGYDPVPFIPALNGVVVGSPEITDRFLWDLRRLVADQVAYEYVVGLREVSHEHGFTTWLENYGHWGFPGEFLQYGGQSDEIAGEFWSFGNLGDIENRAASSCGHIYGKERVWAESCTCGGSNFDLYPATMKQRVDRFFTEGINATLLHLYIQQPDDRTPGINAWFGNEFNRNNTWFSQLDVFLDYLKRCNYMLQQGRYVADVAYFIGEDTPKMTGVRNPEIPRGYSYDYVNAEVLMSAKAVNGKLVLASGMEYSVLVLPKIETMRPELLAKIRELVKEGIVLQGPAPLRSPSLQNYPEADYQIREMAEEMWQRKTYAFAEKVKYGKGMIYPNASIEQIMADYGIQPDFTVSDPMLPVLFIHLTTPEGEIYFVSNQSNETISFDANFRIKGKQPELWNPLTSEVRILPEQKQLTGATSIPMVMSPFESSFVIFRHPIQEVKTNKNYPDAVCVASVKGPWTIEFEENRGGPKEPVVTDVLFDWMESENPQIKYFSGNAVYKTSFEINRIPGTPVYIDLGKVMVMAKIRVNGVDAGGVWTTPYQINITDYLKEGVNELEIEVVNCWRNRMIGELSMPQSERFTYHSAANIKADSEMQSSGLLGPVQVISYPYELIK